jgi:hypothetical protein
MEAHPIDRWQHGHQRTQTEQRRQATTHLQIFEWQLARHLQISYDYGWRRNVESHGGELIEQTTLLE